MTHIRTAVADDAEAIVELHGRTVREVCGRDYETHEIDAWLANQSAERVASRIEGGQVYAAVDPQGHVLGFADRAADSIRALYVAADHRGEGVGSQLLSQLEQDARAEGHDELTTHSTVTAVGFYKHRGYEVVERVECPVARDVPLAAYVVRKRLT